MTRIIATTELTIDKIPLGPYQTNAYILVCPRTRKSVLVDAPAEAGRIIQALGDTDPQYILMTHSHMDHTQALAEVVDRLAAPVLAHEADWADMPVRPDRTAADQQIIRFGQVEIKILHTPGHTAGSISFLIGDQLLSGDTLFPGGPGRTGSPAGFLRIVKSIEDNFLPLEDNTAVHPGHGESTTIGVERPAIQAFLNRPRVGNLCGDVLWGQD